MIFIVIAFVLTLVSADWDIAVSVDNRVELLTASGSRVSSGQQNEFNHLSSLSYDAVFGHFYLSNGLKPNTTIARMEVAEDGRTSGVQTLVAGGDASSSIVQGLTHDPLTATMFWTTGSNRGIWKAAVNVDPIQPIQIHSFTTEIPHGIVADSCQGYIYWTNSFLMKPSLERSRFDGSERSVILSQKLFQPTALTLSQSERMLYWLDENAGHYYFIERSMLDGTKRETVVLMKNHQPFSLVVSQGTVFWTDWTSNSVWSVELMQGVSLPITDLRKVASYTGGAAPRGIVAQNVLDVLVEQDCRDLIDLKTKVPSRVNVTMGTCLHGIKTEKGCRCASGFSGAHCEVSLCHNYCLGGVCTLAGPSSMPVCSCPPFRTGPRCEVVLCPPNYCLNEGQCAVGPNYEVFCKCLQGFYGTRCELNEDFCRVVCLRSNDSDAAFCPCESLTLTDPAESLSSAVWPWRIATYSLAAASVLLALVTIFLLVKVVKLRLRPRFVRRFQVRPPTARPRAPKSLQSGDTPCEISIENCCNMNICETPCYEPEFRAPEKRPKKEEKRNLLDAEVTPGGNSDLF